MEFEGRFAFLTPEEVTDGLQSPFELTDENIRTLGYEIEMDRKKIEAFKAENDTFDRSAQMAIFDAESRQKRRLDMLMKLATETEIFQFSDKLDNLGPDDFLDLTR